MKNIVYLYCWLFTLRFKFKLIITQFDLIQYIDRKYGIAVLYYFHQK